MVMLELKVCFKNKNKFQQLSLISCRVAKQIHTVNGNSWNESNMLPKLIMSRYLIYKNTKQTFFLESLPFKRFNKHFAIPSMAGNLPVIGCIRGKIS